MTDQTPAHEHEPPRVIRLTATIPYRGGEAETTSETLRLVAFAALTEARSLVCDDDAEPIAVSAMVADTANGMPIEGIPAIGPYQLNVLDEAQGLVTVTYPVGSDTVLSAQPGGTWETRPAGTRGPYELALRCPDRLIFNPAGPAGPVMVVPYAATVPNKE